MKGNEGTTAPLDRPEPTPPEKMSVMVGNGWMLTIQRSAGYEPEDPTRLADAIQAFHDTLVAAPARAHQEEKGNEMHDDNSAARGHTTGDPQSSRTAGKDGGSQNARAEQAFEDWWAREGRWVDPDTSDVPWFDKRKELCALAFIAATAQSRNYVADREVCPREITFTNGRKVMFNGADCCLDVVEAERG